MPSIQRWPQGLTDGKKPVESVGLRPGGDGVSVGAEPIGAQPIAAQANSSSGGKGGPPPKRTLVATSDAVAQPEPR